MAQTKTGLLYTKEHDWLCVNGTSVRIGITDYAQAALGDIVFADHEPIGSVVMTGGPLGVVESVKAASDIAAPVSGTLTGANDAVIQNPELLNSAPYDNHLFELELSDPSELDGLLDEAAYLAYCGGLH